MIFPGQFAIAFAACYCYIILVTDIGVMLVYSNTFFYLTNNASLRWEKYRRERTPGVCVRRQRTTRQQMTTDQTETINTTKQAMAKRDTMMMAAVVSLWE